MLRKNTHEGGEETREQLSGLIERVTYHSEESGFCVLRVKARGHREQVTVVGTIPDVAAGEWLVAGGRWIVDKEYGRQFRAEVLKTTAPNTLEGIEKYLGSGLIRGIGPVFAGRMVAMFGEDVLDVIDREPGKLRRVAGIGRKRHRQIVAAWAEQKAIRDIMVFLHAHGVSTSRAFRIYKTYGERAIEQVSEDPYCLARDIWGIGFLTADRIAESLGIGGDSDLRARAGVEYVLQQATEQGHCGYGRVDLAEKTAASLDIPRDRVETAVDYLVAKGRLIPRDGENGDELVFLAGLDTAEEELAASLAGEMRAGHPCREIDVQKAIVWVEGHIGMELAAGQRNAVRVAARSGAMVITGGPGVGKTTVINAIVKIFRAKKLRVVLAAPTGRAAKRMAEISGMPAGTIHRLLEFDPKIGGFRRDARNPLDGDIFIIDEVSMLDVTLAWRLIRAVPRDAAVILVGDVDQLPSVGPGCVLRDIIQSETIPVCRLTEVFRQAARSSIITNAHAVNSGRMPDYPRDKVASPSATDFYFVPAEDPDAGVELIRRLVCEDIPRKFGFHPLDDIQLLSPMQRGGLGCHNLNRVMQEALNSAGEGIERFGVTYRAGDKVMQIVNNYDKDVFNGDIGIVRKIDPVEKEVAVRFGERILTYDVRELDELVHAYATTIHKAQGSEFPAVVMAVHTQHYPLLERNLLYTGITRSRRLVVLVGTERAMAIAVNRKGARHRITLLKERLRSAAAEG